MSILNQISRNNIRRNKLQVISLCSGAGLFDLALRDAGLDIAVQVENAHPQLEILEEAFPEAKRHTDIFSFRRKDVEKYGIVPEETAIIGGLCCQPFSYVGPRRGRRKSTWMCRELVRITREMQPRYVLAENVYGFIDHIDGLAWLSAEMGKIGFEGGEAISFSADSLGVPEKRERVFVLYTKSEDLPYAAGVGRNMEALQIDSFIARSGGNYWNGRSVSQPGVRSVAIGQFTEAQRNYYEEVCRAFGNGVIYDVGYFIGRTLKHLEERFRW